MLNTQREDDPFFIVRSDTQLGKARIFVVSGREEDQNLVAQILEGAGYNAPVRIFDPSLVIEHYQRQAPDLILVDLGLLRSHGYALQDQLQLLQAPILPPMMALLGDDSRETRLKALADGVRDFVCKPYDEAELLMRVLNLLEVHLAQRMVHNQKAVLEQMVQARTAELHDSRLEIVRRLGRAAEYRDNETGLHIIRMSKYSALIARSMGWSEAACELMLHASPMHDIGKIGIPDGVLLKPGKFDPAEWEVMKQHTVIGAEILGASDSELLKLARTIALTHHEKWDGSGYPRGLYGAEIPLAGRIVAVADVFDALTSPRPYKQAWPVQDAVQYLQDQAGAHFDPEVVRHFLSLLPQVLEIQAENPEPPELATH